MKCDNSDKGNGRSVKEKSGKGEVERGKEIKKVIGDFKELIVWQKSYQLCLEIYQISKSFPTDERFGLISQMRRAAISIPSNIAEGAGRNSTKEYIHFLYIAKGSLCELETQLLISKDLGHCSINEFEKLRVNLIEVHRILQGLITSLNRKGDEK